MSPLRRLAAAVLAATVMVGAATAFVATDAQACGACHGDKIAIVYDHATVLQALKDGKAVQFCDVEGGFMGADEKGIAFMRKAVSAVAGIQKDTIKVSSEPTAVAFVFDPKQGKAIDFLDRINARLEVKGWKLTHLRTIDADHP